jgi:hypothetical protein
MANEPIDELRKAFAAAQVELREGEDIDAGRLYEFAPADLEDARGFAVLGDDETHLGIRIDLPNDSALFGKPHSDSEALLALGAITAAFAGERISARLVSGGQGIEGVLLTTRRCGRLDHKEHQASSEALIDAARSLHLEISAGPTATLFDRLAQRRTPADSDLLEVELGDQPEIVPTYDPATRDRLLRR